MSSCRPWVLRQRAERSVVSIWEQRRADELPVDGVRRLEICATWIRSCQRRYQKGTSHSGGERIWRSRPGRMGSGDGAAVYHGGARSETCYIHGSSARAPMTQVGLIKNTIYKLCLYSHIVRSSKVVIFILGSKDLNDGVHYS